MQNLEMNVEVEGILQHLKKKNIPVFIACSGGVDSICLLHWFLHQNIIQFSNIKVLHFDHQMRKDSYLDQKPILKILKSYPIPFIKEKVDKGQTLLNEQDARNARLQFFQRQITPDNPKCYLLQAHHANDVAETILMSLSKGGGIDALSSPKPCSQLGDLIILRPFIEISKSALLKYAQYSGLEWIEDLTNKNEKHLRNRIRKSVIPALQQNMDPNRDLLKGISLSRSQLELDADCLNQIACNLYREAKQNASSSNQLVFKQKKELHKSTFKRILYSWAKDMNFQSYLNSKNLSLIIDAFFDSQRAIISLSPDCSLEILNDTLNFAQKTKVSTPNWKLNSIMVNSCFELEGGFKFETTRVDWKRGSVHSFDKIDTKEECWLDADKVFKGGKEILILRPLETGDRYPPLGMQQEKKLKDCFINRKIPKLLRNFLPVILNNENKILWVPGLLPSNSYKINETTRVALRLTIKLNSEYWNILSI